MHSRNIQREQLLHAILYFCSHIKYPTYTKIFKLLAFSDFRHFNETGRSITGMKYFTYDYGPVPEEFYLDIDEGKVPQDFKKFLAIKPFGTGEKAGHLFVKLKKPDLEIFSPRQQKILKEIAEIYKDTDAGLTSDISHLDGTPWKKTRQKYGNKKTEIDYLLAIEKDSLISLEDAKNSLEYDAELLKSFPPFPCIQES